MGPKAVILRNEQTPVSVIIGDEPNLEDAAMSSSLMIGLLALALLLVSVAGRSDVQDQ